MAFGTIYYPVLLYWYIFIFLSYFLQTL